MAARAIEPWVTAWYYLIASIVALLGLFVAVLLVVDSKGIKDAVVLMPKPAPRTAQRS